MNDLGAPSALIIAHPGHELRVYGWVAEARPVVFILTDGSGRTGRSRLDSTSRILNEVGAEPGCIYGRLTDRELYQAILDHSFELLISLTEELAQSLLYKKIRYVAGDAIEGYNPSHDMCRVIIDAAVKLASRATGHEIGNFDFLLGGHPDPHAERSQGHAIRVRLDSQGLARKLAAARRYGDLANDVNESLSRWGEEPFQTECLRSVEDDAGRDFDTTPFYEEYGERQVSKGYYDRVLRYREHFLPVARAIRRHVKESDDWPAGPYHE